MESFTNLTLTRNAQLLSQEQFDLIVKNMNYASFIGRFGRWIRKEFPSIKAPYERWLEALKKRDEPIVVDGVKLEVPGEKAMLYLMALPAEVYLDLMSEWMKQLGIDIENLDAYVV